MSEESEESMASEIVIRGIRGIRVKIQSKLRDQIEDSEVSVKDSVEKERGIREIRGERVMNQRD